MGTIEELRAELVRAYAQSAERAAFIAGQTEANGYCPFIVGGRQFIAGAFKGRPGYRITIELGLDDAERAVELVDVPAGLRWDATGDAGDAAVWIGNATEHDREAILRLARDAGPGEAVRVSSPGVLTFVLDWSASRYRAAVV
jgi:hypothetical protein